MNIYQAIWDADQSGNGIQPVLNENDGDPSIGYVVVNEKIEADSDHKLFSKVVIPSHKMSTYNLCKRLFNNYTLDKTKREDPTPEEAKEVHEFLEGIVDTAPMKIAREWMETQTGEAFSIDRWYTILQQIWFAEYDHSSGRDLTGFEHVVLGEQKGSIVSGYHFWYKYYLDDSFELLNSDDIQYLGTRGDGQEENLLVPEVSTISYKWEAFDYDAGAKRPLYKKIGGFFNGCSVEGLLAIGTIRFLPQGRAPKEAIINGTKYNLRLYRSPNNQHLTTYYPVFLSRVAKPVDGALKIIASLINPIGHDPGFESVTIINIDGDSINLNGWRIEDKNGNSYILEDQVLPIGQAITIVLPEDTAQLSNKGGRIRLIDPQYNLVDEVSYSRSQVKEQGTTLIF